MRATRVANWWSFTWKSGRTHQIRVHLAYLGHPLLGDRLYGRGSLLVNRHFLHAHHLGFAHPRSGEPVEFRCGLPQDLQRALELLEQEATGVANP